MVLHKKKPRPDSPAPLMMRTVDGHALSEKPTGGCIFSVFDRMKKVAVVREMRTGSRKILNQRSAEKHVQHLHSAAYAEDRFFFRRISAQQIKLVFVPCAIGRKAPPVLFSEKVRIHVPAAAKNKPVAVKVLRQIRRLNTESRRRKQVYVTIAIAICGRENKLRLCHEHSFFRFANIPYAYEKTGKKMKEAVARFLFIHNIIRRDTLF